MIKIAVYVTGALIALVLLLLAVLKYLRNEIKILRCQLEVCEKEKQGFAEQVQRLSSAAEITRDVRKKTDEKNAELHSGDAVDNAVMQLSKSKN